MKEFFILSPVGICHPTYFICLDWYYCWCPEIGTGSIKWAEQSRFLADDRDRIQSLKHCGFKKVRTKDSIQEPHYFVNRGFVYIR
jgi:hypothetical protein